METYYFVSSSDSAKSVKRCNMAEKETCAPFSRKENDHVPIRSYAKFVSVAKAAIFRREVVGHKTWHQVPFVIRDLIRHGFVRSNEEEINDPRIYCIYSLI